MTTIKLGMFHYLQLSFIHTWLMTSYRVTESLEFNFSPESVARKPERKVAAI